MFYFMLYIVIYIHIFLSTMPNVYKMLYTDFIVCFVFFPVAFNIDGYNYVSTVLC